MGTTIEVISCILAVVIGYIVGVWIQRFKW